MKFSPLAYIKQHQSILQTIDVAQINTGIELIRSAFEGGKKILTCGNGGSSHTASHYVTDWTKMISMETGRKFRGFSLCDNVGLITAFGNDVDYSEIFAGQIRALMDEGDLLVAVSGSGNSVNVLKAISAARSVGGKTLGVVGYDGGKMLDTCDHCVLVPSFDMQLCEDIHLMFGHMVMKTICGREIVEFSK